MPAAYVLSWQDPDTGLTETVEFDLVTAAQHENLLAITTHPVEVGANPADHASEEPARLTIEGYVSSIGKRGEPDMVDTTASAVADGFAAPGTKTVVLDVPKPPLGLSSGLSGLVQAGLKELAGPLKATFRDELRRIRSTLNLQMMQQSSPRDRVRDVFDRLERAQRARALITAQTPIREYFDMMLERLPAQQDDGTGEGATFAIDLVRIVVADSQTVQAPEPAERRGQSAKSAGSQNGKDDPNGGAKKEKLKSSAAQLADGDILA